MSKTSKTFAAVLLIALAPGLLAAEEPNHGLGRGTLLAA